jgi:organic radical activating enzyme
MNLELVNSFTAANSLPLKILMNPKLSDSIISKHKILPWHLQLNPTNKCSFNCSFCSCKNRDKSAEVPFEDFVQLITERHYPSVTITGGGEPTFYSKINELIHLLKQNKTEIGLVTNGSNIQALDKKSLKQITWCRISCSDELTKQTNLSQWFKKLDVVIRESKNIDWAFSYVHEEKTDFSTMRKIIQFGNKHNFTHIRIVSDLLNLKHVGDMSIIERMLKHYGEDCSRIIFQGRKQFVHGQKKCYISLLKPVISAEGKLFPCCGVQYALENPSLDYEKTMCMGSIKDLPSLIDKQKYFDGSNCVRCYYSDYNYLLGALMSNLRHVKFV